MSSFYGRVLADIHDSDFAFWPGRRQQTAMSLLPLRRNQESSWTSDVVQVSPLRF